MNNQLLIRLSIILSFILVGIIAQAQDPAGTSNHNEQVTIISSFDPSINQAYKVNTSPDDVIFNIEKPKFTYQSLDINQPTEIVLESIKPVVINADKKVTSTNNSLKAGVGSLLSPYLDFFHSSGKKNDYRFNAHLYQLSTFKNIKDLSPSPQSTAYLDLDYSKFFKYHILDAGFIYSFNSNRYYGFNPDELPANVSIPDSRLKQSFNLAKVNLGIVSNYRNNKKLYHNINVDAYYYFDKHKTSESNANFNFDVRKNFNVTEMLDYQELGVKGNISYYGNKDSLVSTTDLLVAVTPYFNGKYGIFSFNVGLNFNILNTDKSNFYFYPILDINVNLIPDILTVFGGIDGDVYRQSFLKLTELNPWVGSTTNLKWDHAFKAYGGIRGNFGQKVNYSAQVSWKKFNEMYFFINVQDGVSNPKLPYNKFDAVYDGGSVFGVSGEVTYAASEKVNVLFGAKYNAYSLDSLESPYHKPSSEVMLGISFLATSKMKIWSEVYYYGKRVALAVDEIPIKEIDLDGFIDLNAGIDYKLTDNFSVFLTLTNILNTDYQRYYKYPVHGIQVMGGLTYKF